jgi:RecJ-like exonuclease
VRTYDLDQHKLFYFDIMDESGSLRVKAFDRQCDRVFPSVCIGEVRHVVS